MRVLIFFLILSAAALNMYAQTTPTLSETIAYIDKRVKETQGHQVKWKSGKLDYLVEASFYSSSSLYKIGKYRYLYQSKDNNWASHYFTFKPEHISSVTEGSTNTTADSPVGFITINFANNLVKQDSRNWYHNGGIYSDEGSFINSYSTQGNVSHLFIPYLKQDATAFDRISKAIMHLKKLSQKDDPFADF